MKTHTILLILCLLTAPRFSTGDDFTASESPNGPPLAPRYAPPDTLSDGPPRSTPEEGIPSRSAPSLLPPSLLERTPYYEDSPQSGFIAGPRPAGRSGRFAPSHMAPTYEGLGTNGRDPHQSFEPGTGTGHDCPSHGSNSSHAPPSSLPYSGHSRYRKAPAGDSQCQDDVCEFGYRGGSLSTRTRQQYRNESPQAPMSRFEGNGHDHSHGDGHSHSSHDQATTSPDARQPRCPVDGTTLGSRGRPAALLVDGQPVYLCSEQCMMQLLQKSGHDTPDHSTDEFESFGSPSEEHDHSHSH
jgi:hypothetical protein